MVPHRRGLFKRAALFEIGGDLGCPEVVIVELGCDPGRGRARRIIT
jgi:hypothetical protein